MAVNLPRTSMSVPEKLQIIEEIRTNLCQNLGDAQSPQWHAEVLEARRQRLKSGQAKVSACSDVKERLGKLGR